MQLFTETLPHQQVAIDKLLPLTIGALFMEMGTGKTRTAIELAFIRQTRGKISKVAWFCPVTLKDTIYHEILKHTDCSPKDIHVFGDNTNERNLPDCFWYIIGIESMSSSNRVVLASNTLLGASTMAIVDESSYIKGHKALRTERITYLCRTCRYRMLLTGTPISQGVVDLYSQMRFLSPEILGYNSFYSFAANHLEFSKINPGKIVRSHNTGYIAAKISPYIYQVTKGECLTLPQKNYETRILDLSGEQWSAYNQAKEEILMECTEDDWNSVVIFRLFTALQQIVCGFWRRSRSETLYLCHYRLEALISVINNIPPQEKIIIWCKYKYDMHGISETLTKEYGEESFACYYGKIPVNRRPAELARFKNHTRFLVATLGSGGHGLTLNESGYVIFYNNSFKYSERLQAEDRNHRIGQKKEVRYIDLECYGTIDSKISKSLARKEDMVEAFRGRIEKVKREKHSLEKLIMSI